jgi:type VI secretion system protein ImpF
MARAELERTVRQPLLDRLIDDTPGLGDVELRFSESVARLKDAVRRDLEWLLNTRRTPEPAPDQYAELRRSMFHYGVPDITSLGRESGDARRRLQRSFEEAITLFEPRLTDVRVTQPEVDDFKRELRFQIEAVLRMEPNPETVLFDTVCDLASGELEIRSDVRA